MPWLALLIPIAAWGLSFPSIKAALTEFPPMTLAFGRFVLAAGFLTVVSLVKKQKMFIAPKDRGSLILSVATGITLYFLCENNGVKLISASAASLIIAGIPILTLLADRLVSRTRLGKWGVGASLVSLGGAALLVGTPSASAANPWGYALMAGAAGAWVLYLFTMKPLQSTYPNLTLTTWQMILGAISFAPFAWAEHTQWSWPSAVGWGNLAFQGVVCSAVSYLLYNYALDKLGMRTASLAVNLIPVVTAVASYFLLGELLGVWQWLGGVLVLGAVVAVGLNAGSEGKPEPSSPSPLPDSEPRSDRRGE